MVQCCFQDIYLRKIMHAGFCCCCCCYCCCFLFVCLLVSFFVLFLSVGYFVIECQLLLFLLLFLLFLLLLLLLFYCFSADNHTYDIFATRSSAGSIRYLFIHSEKFCQIHYALRWTVVIVSKRNSSEN